MKLQSWDLWGGRLPPPPPREREEGCPGNVLGAHIRQMLVSGRPAWREKHVEGSRHCVATWLKLQTMSTDLERSMVLQRIKSSNGARLQGLLAGQNLPALEGAQSEISILKQRKREWPELASSQQQSTKWIIITSGESKPGQKKRWRVWTWCCTLWWVLKSQETFLSLVFVVLSWKIITEI